MSSGAEIIPEEGSATVASNGTLAKTTTGQEQPLKALAELPELVIEPRPGWHLVDVREIWRHRELLYFLAWRDVKVRYKQTVLGGAWAILQPLATMIVFVVFLGRAVRQPDAEIPYSLFVFAGLLPWTFFSRSINSGGQSVVADQNLITKIYFPRLIVPMSAVAGGVIDLAVGFLMLAALMLYDGVFPGTTVLALPLVLLLLLVASLGVGTLLAALTVEYRDFRHLLPFMVQIWMFATPTIYLQAENLVGPRWRPYLPLNPAYGLILNFRQTLLGGPLDWYALAVSGGVSVLLLLVGCFYFRRVERGFADII